MEQKIDLSQFSAEELQAFAAKKQALETQDTRIDELKQALVDLKKQYEAERIKLEKELDSYLKNKATKEDLLITIVAEKTAKPKKTVKKPSKKASPTKQGEDRVKAILQIIIDNNGSTNISKIRKRLKEQGFNFINLDRTITAMVKRQEIERLSRGNYRIPE